MRTAAIFFTLQIALTPGLAAAPSSLLKSGEVQVVRSRSGQFVVANSGTVLSRRPASPLSTNTALVDLDPNILAVSCERVKQTLLRELGIVDVWRGRVYVVINPVIAGNSPAVIGAKPFTDGWHYRVEVPLQMDRGKLVRGLVQVLLMEIANRTAGLRSAEIPLWLSEGLTQHLMHSSEIELVLSEPRLTYNRVNASWFAREAIRRDPLDDVRERLRTHTALTFARLGEPLPEPLPEETWKTYQASAQLFVHQLLVLYGGRAQLVEMLLQLPHFLNWQSAFLNAFRFHFAGLLDVEKRWAVVLVHFTGLDPTQAWKPEVALPKLNETLNPPVLVTVGARQLPQRAQLPVQRIINEWDYLRQRIVLRQVINQLVILRVKIPPELLALVDDYRKTLEEYLSKHDSAGIARSLPGLPATRTDMLVRDVVKRLNELDQRRAALASASAAVAGDPKASNALARPEK